MVLIAVMLGILVGPLVVSQLFERLTRRRLLDSISAGSLGATLVFCFTGLGHFVLTKQMAAMLPPWAPGRIPLVYATGVLEFAAAFALMLKPLRRFAGVGLILMLIGFLPVNVYAALQRIEFGGHEFGPAYLLIRVPLQLLLIGWIWWFAVRAPER